MKIQDLNSVLQAVESMGLIAKELEKAINRKDAEKTKKAKDELLELQKQISKVIE